MEVTSENCTKKKMKKKILCQFHVNFFFIKCRTHGINWLLDVFKLNVLKQYVLLCVCSNVVNVPGRVIFFIGGQILFFGGLTSPLVHGHAGVFNQQVLQGVHQRRRQSHVLCALIRTEYISGNSSVLFLSLVGCYKMLYSCSAKVMV